MSGTPKVSILFCAYNQAAFIESALESLNEQTYANLEVIAVDNGSTDESRKIFEKYRQNAKFKLLLHEKNAPVTSRLNEAFKASSGEFVGLLYGDDLYLPEFVSTAVSAFDSLDSSYGVVYTLGYRENVLTKQRWEEPLLEHSGNVFEFLLKNWFHGAQMNPISALSRRRCFEKHPFLSTLFTEGESIYLRFAMTEKFFYIKKPLVIMRDHKSNIGKALKKNLETVHEVLRSLGEEREFPRELSPLLSKCRIDMYRHYAWQGIRVLQDKDWVIECVSKGMRISPLFLFHWKTVLAYCMAFLPLPFLKSLNQFGHSLRKHSMVLSHREGYA